MVKARSGAGGRPVGQLPPQPWLTHPATRRVIAALTAEGGEVRFVGGCVRDALLQRSVNDIDLATPERPELVLARLAQASLRALPTGLAHGTVTALVDGQTFEITTLRRDVACDGRRAVVAYTDNWAEDAARRDFTINALSADPAGSVYDPFDGLPDLHHGRVRFVGSPRTRIEEDVLRLLRYFRFHGWYGRPPPDREALAACRALAPRLATLSAERVRDELWKILLVPDPASMLLLMQGERVLAHVLPEAGAFGCLRLLAWFEGHGLRVEGIAPDPLRRLAAVLTVQPAAAAAVGRRLRLSKRETDRLLGLLEIPPDLTPTPDMATHVQRRALQSLGAKRFRDVVLLRWAARRVATGRTAAAAAESALWLHLLETAVTWKTVPFPISGRDVLALGVEPGPQVGALLTDLRRWWEETGCQVDRSTLLARLARQVEDGKTEAEHGQGNRAHENIFGCEITTQDAQEYQSP